LVAAGRVTKLDVPLAAPDGFLTGYNICQRIAGDIPYQHLEMRRTRFERQDPTAGGALCRLDREETNVRSDIDHRVVRLDSEDGVPVVAGRQINVRKDRVKTCGVGVNRDSMSVSEPYFGISRHAGSPQFHSDDMIKHGGPVTYETGSLHAEIQQRENTWE
jgi:hypothetical protein